jgi:uncharacterized protein YcbX
VGRHLDAALDGGPLMRVAELWRYPVKSLLGERLDAARVGPDGIQGDRHWALVDLATGAVLTARRDPQLLFAAARLRPDGGVDIVLPDGTVTADDAVLSAWLGRPVALRSAGVGAFHDEEWFRVSLVSSGTLGRWDRRRFRANVVLEGEGEDALVGRGIRLGSVELRVGASIDRCVMVTRPQAGGIGRDTGVLKTLHRERGGLLAVGATVRTPGTVGAGDPLTVLGAD